LARALEASPTDLCRLDFDLAELWAVEVLRMLEQHGTRPADVDVLGSHGQTVAHVPKSPDRPKSPDSAATLQIGQADVLAERTGILTVSDFRTRDIAAGGEGAPLVPLADWILYAEPGATTACHNLGSIANVTVIPERQEHVWAFDTGPANALLDCFAEGIDRDGRVSATGSVNKQLLRALSEMRAGWLSQPPPKSAGYDTFGPGFAQEVLSAHEAVPRPDLLRTAVQFTAETIGDAYERLVLPRHPDLSRVRFSGGGCHNPTLMAAIRSRLEPLEVPMEVMEPEWIDAKEAVAFALLADATVRGRTGNLPGATGAQRPVVLGKISL
ncbi:MAG: anhydro-N-acetylmuramic acid kinase, partial [Planctomycetota bacterium]